MTKVALLGLGKDNLALLKIFDKHRAPIELTICDLRKKNGLPLPKLKHLQLNFRLGADFNQGLDEFDILYRSPGWPLNCPGIKTAQKKNKNIKLDSAINFFFSTCPSKNIIGVTGSKGKGTTATLLSKIIKASLKPGQNVFLGGNIGISPLEFLEKIKPTDFIVLELSSFQLEDIRYSPKYSIITNLYPEHLAPADPYNPNYHSSLAQYFQAKIQIAKHLENKFLLANESLKTKIEELNLTTKVDYFSKLDLKTKMVGDYNQENISACVALAKLLKIKPETYLAVIASFTNLEHRLELVRELRQVKYYDNSFSTTPESTILDIKSFSSGIILIAGGADKGASFKELAQVIKTRVKEVIFLPGKGTERIIAELKKINYQKKLLTVKSMAQAVEKASQLALPQDTVLLSTACASFGLFKNYKERGNLFKENVKNLK